MTFWGVYQVSCGPIPMKIGGNRPEAFPNLPIQSKKQYLSRKTTIIRLTKINCFRRYFLTDNFFILFTTALSPVNFPFKTPTY